MTAPAAASLTSDPNRAREIQDALKQVLRLANILSGSVPGPNMARDGTRAALLPRVAALSAVLQQASAEPLLESRCTLERDFFEGDPPATAESRATISTSSTPATPTAPPATGTAPTTTTVMGAPATMADRASLAADAAALAERQATAIVVWAVSNASSLETWWTAFNHAWSQLHAAVLERANALAGALSGAGRNLRDFFAAWAIEAQRRWDALVSTLGIAAGVGAGAGILFLALLLAYMASRH